MIGGVNRHYASSSSKKGYESLEDFTNQLKAPKEFNYNEPTDFEFIAKELDIPLQKDGSIKSEQLEMLDRAGVQRFDMNDPESRIGMKQLERLLRTPNGKQYLNLMLADIKETFGVASEAEMKNKTDHLLQELSMRLGEPVEEFIKRTMDSNVELSDMQREVLSEYNDRHPYLKHIRQTGMIMDLVSLVDTYSKSDTKTFEENFAKRFGAVNVKSDIDTANHVDNTEADSFLTSGTAEQTAQEKMLELIKSDTLSAYLDHVFLSAQTQLVPQSDLMARQADLDQEKAGVAEIDEADRDLYTPTSIALYPDVDLLKPVEQQQQAKDPRNFLKYYNLYPRKVRKWIDYSHTPLGFFTGMGVWYNFPAWYSKHFQPSQPEQIVTEESVSSNFDEKEIPEDLRGVYRFGVTPEEAQILHPKLRDFLSFRNASQNEINAYRKQVCVQKYGKNDADTGSASVQIAVFTERINYLAAYTAKFKKDNVAKRKMLLLQSQRKSMINYLKGRDVVEYFRITKDLKIRNTDV
eukprot:gene3745-4319_t